jgi:hypothetical protein
MLQEAVFFMPLFGPWIRKEDENTAKAHSLRESVKAFPGIRLQKVKSFQIALIALSTCLFDATGDQVDSETIGVPVLLRESGEVVPMSTTHFERQRGSSGINAFKLAPEFSDALGSHFERSFVTR